MAEKSKARAKYENLSLEEQAERIATMFSSPQFVKMLHELSRCDPEERETCVRKWADPVVLEGMGIPVPDGATITMRYFFDDPKVEGLVSEGTIRKPNLPGRDAPSVDPDVGPFALCAGGGAAGVCVCGGA